MKAIDIMNMSSTGNRIVDNMNLIAYLLLALEASYTHASYDDGYLSYDMEIEEMIGNLRRHTEIMEEELRYRYSWCEEVGDDLPF